MTLLNHLSLYFYYQWDSIFYTNFYLLKKTIIKTNEQTSRFVLIPQGAVAGFLDSIGGGGWGPVNTPLILAQKKLEPRYAIGTVSASEFS